MGRVSRGKTMESLVYQAKKRGAGVGEHSCVEGQNGKTADMG